MFLNKKDTSAAGIVISSLLKVSELKFFILGVTNIFIFILKHLFCSAVKLLPVQLSLRTTRFIF